MCMPHSRAASIRRSVMRCISWSNLFAIARFGKSRNCFGKVSRGTPCSIHFFTIHALAAVSNFSRLSRSFGYARTLKNTMDDKGARGPSVGSRIVSRGICATSDERSPFLHERAAFFEHIATPIRSLGFIFDDVRQSHLRHFICEVGFLRCPVFET